MDAHGQARQPSGTGKMIAALGLAVLAYVLYIVIGTVGYVLGDGDEWSWGYIVMGAVSALPALGFVCLLGGKDLAAPRVRGLLGAWKIVWILMVMALVFGGLSIYDPFEGVGVEVVEGWPERLAMTAVTCLGIGIFEEFTCRGLVLQGLLGRMGASRKGVVAACVISALFFGFIHVMYDLAPDPLTIAQAVMKTLSSGAFGFAMVGVVLKTRSLWPAVLFHGAYDFLLMIVDALTAAVSETVYVVQDTEEAVSTIVMYAVILVVSIPAIVKTVKLIREAPVPYRGAFYRYEAGGTVPGSPEAPAAAGVVAAGAPVVPGSPVPPTGVAGSAVPGSWDAAAGAAGPVVPGSPKDDPQRGQQG